MVERVAGTARDRAADAGHVRRSGPAVRLRFGGREPARAGAGQESAARDSPAGRHRRRRPLRQEQGVRRQDDLSARHRLARRRGLLLVASQLLEADRYRRRRRGRSARRAGHRLCQHGRGRRHARRQPRPRRPALLVRRPLPAQDSPPRRTRDSRRHRALDPALPARRLRAGSRLRLARQRGRRGLHARGRHVRQRHVPGAQLDGRGPARRAGPLRRWRRVSRCAIACSTNTNAPATCCRRWSTWACPPPATWRCAAPANWATTRAATCSRRSSTCTRSLRHRIDRSGATFTCRNEDFLVSSDPDFHPTDVLEDADGSLLVVNTGGWFRIGCPTSQVEQARSAGRHLPRAARRCQAGGRSARLEDRLRRPVARGRGQTAGRPAVCRARPCGRPPGEAGRSGRAPAGRAARQRRRQPKPSARPCGP